MLEQRQRDIDLLNALTPATVSVQAERSTDLLGTMCQNPPYSQLPDAWEGGFCAGWHFAVHRACATALDIMLTPRKDQETNRDTLVWTQGSAFNFTAGYTVHTAPRIDGQPWSEMLAGNTSSLQVQDSLPAVPASVEIHSFFLSELQAPLDMEAEEEAANPNRYPHEWRLVRKSNSHKPKDPKTGRPPSEEAWELRVSVPRNAGKVTYCHYVRSPDGTAMIPHHTKTCTQDDFVRLLITGEEPEALE